MTKMQKIDKLDKLERIQWRNFQQISDKLTYGSWLN